MISFEALSADELADVAWGLGAAHHYTDRLSDMETGLLRVMPGRLRPLHVATSLWAFARLDWVPSRLLSAIGPTWRLAGPKPARGRRKAEPALSAMTARQLGTCAWALASLQQTSAPCFEARPASNLLSSPPERSLRCVIQEGLRKSRQLCR